MDHEYLNQPSVARTGVRTFHILATIWPYSAKISGVRATLAEYRMSRVNQETVQVGSKKLQTKIKTILAKWNALEILIGFEIGNCILCKTTNQQNNSA